MRVKPPGIYGGAAGQPAAIIINPGTEREKRLTQMVTDYQLTTGDVVEIQTAGGGGWGDLQGRDPEYVERDLREERLHSKQAEGNTPIAKIQTTKHL